MGSECSDGYTPVSVAEVPGAFSETLWYQAQQGAQGINGLSRIAVNKN